MAVEWEVLTLREAGVSLTDCDHRTPPAAEAGYPYVAIPQLRAGRIEFKDARRISPEHFAEWTRKAKPAADDVVLSRRCNPGETAFVSPGVEFALGQNLVLLRADGKRVHPPFLRWLTRGPQWWEQIGKFINVGAVFNSLKCADVPKFELTIPPLPEQRAIAHILGTLDDKIELNRSRNRTLEAMARALFKDWFVDFGPVRAKMEDQAPYLPADLWRLFPDRLDGEGKPEGWEIRPLADFIDIFDSRRVPLSGKQRAERQGPYPYHGAAGVMDSVDDFLFEGVHVLLGEDGSVVKADGRPFTQYVWDKFWVNNHAHVLRGRGITSETLLVFLDQCDVAPFVTGAVQPKLSQGNLKAIPFIDAGNALLRRFGEIVDPLFAQIRDATEEAHTLAQLRDTLLPKLISGELRIVDAERFIARSA